MVVLNSLQICEREFRLPTPPLQPHSLSINLLSIRYLIPTQEVGNALTIFLALRVCMGSGGRLSDGLPALAPTIARLCEEESFEKLPKALKDESLYKGPVQRFLNELEGGRVTLTNEESSSRPTTAVVEETC
ncbi:hypothetical protein EVAR_94634_1 [Eumeta japonica]|uniref:Uncharacterized protein n=1 Tax=Eumeta variegata TaxID=151549 RepID=A0A4C1UVH5_EUMVA|nr:hypothetical protein EVAR_94634_1 [Eumeta japonica]